MPKSVIRKIPIFSQLQHTDKKEKRNQNIENFPQNTRSKQEENTMAQPKPSPFRSAQVAGDGR